MKDVMFLVHRIPYPPNKGDKIRSYNILKKLSETYNVHLGAFVDQEEDLKYKDKVGEFCASYKIIKINKIKSRIKSLLGVINSKSFTKTYYENKQFQDWVDSTANKYKIKDVLVFSSSMAQFVEHSSHEFSNKLIDFVDVDSEKWKQYGEGKFSFQKFLYRREYKLLSQYERNIAKQFDISIFVSEQEKNIFLKNNDDLSNKIIFIENGVSEEFLHAELHKLDNPYSKDEKVLVFTGAMDYRANVDAVTWFVNDILPKVLESFPSVMFYIVGSNPVSEVKKLASSPNIVVTGFVDDIRPYISYSSAAIAPLRIARGIQNKVLEAMALGKSVVATKAAMEGISIPDSISDFVVDEPRNFADKVINLLNKGDQVQCDSSIKNVVLENYKWSTNLHKFINILEEA